MRLESVQANRFGGSIMLGELARCLDLARCTGKQGETGSLDQLLRCNRPGTQNTNTGILDSGDRGFKTNAGGAAIHDKLDLRPQRAQHMFCARRADRATGIG